MLSRNGEGMKVQKACSAFWRVGAFILAAAMPAAAQSADPTVHSPAPQVIHAPHPDYWGASVLPGSSPGPESRGRSVGCSSSYCLRQATLDAAGQPVATATTRYALNASLGQELVVGCSSSPHYVLQSGFWGRYGSTLVPVLLMVTKAPGNSDWPKLD